MGMEWSLLPPRGQREKQKFIEFAESRGQSPIEREAKNGYRCLRVENGDLPALMEAVLQEFYSVTPDTTMDLIYAGFTWP